jgi:hypothetical protein
MHMGHLAAVGSGCDGEVVVISNEPGPMEREDYLQDIHIRILRVTDDLRAIQRQLNCAAMEAPSDPELMEALSQLPEMDALQMLKSSVDQMRHFLWFYMQVMTNESESGEKLRQSIRQKVSGDSMVTHETSFLEKFKATSDAALMRYLSDGKNRKPN